MRTPASRLLLVLAPAALIAAGATGCAASTAAATPSSTPSSAASAGPAPSTAAPVTKGPKGSKGSTSKGGGAQQAVAACRTDDVKFTFTTQEPNGQTDRALLLVENASKKVCRVNGWVTVSLTNPANEVVPVPTTKVRQPGDPTPIDLPPGTNAFAGIKWVTCDKADESCFAGNSLRVSLSASTDGQDAELEDFPAPEQNNITMKKLQIGTLQPSRQGVVAW